MSRALENNRVPTPCAVLAAIVFALALAPSPAPLASPAGRAAESESPRPMRLMDIAELSRALDPQLSPNGRSVLYALSHADWKAGRAIWQIWRRDIGASAPVELTFAENGVIPGSTRWSPDGKTILFARGGQLLLMSTDGGEPTELTRHATSASAPTWSPDGRAVYFLAADARMNEERERDRVRDDLFAYDEDFKQRHLWKVTVKTGGEQPITSGDFSVASYRLSRDGQHIAFARVPSPLAADEDKTEIWTMDANGQNARALTSSAAVKVVKLEPELSPDNRQLLFLAPANARLEPYYNQNLFVMPATGGSPAPLIPDFPYEFDRATWAPDGRSILAVVNMGLHSEIFRIDVATRAFAQLTDGRHSIPSFPAPAWMLEPHAGKLVFLLDEPNRFGDAWTLMAGAGGPAVKTSPRRVTASAGPHGAAATTGLARVTGVYDTLETTFALPRQKRFEWKGADGAAVDGIVFYPADYHADVRYPLVVQMHGGPAESDKFGSGPGLLLSYPPVLTGKGYVVLRPNYRGSAGYGNAFYRDVVGHYFNNMALDVMAGVDALVDGGIADPDRLVLMGWSAGGHLVNKLITMTDRFKAASAGASAANFTSLYAQTDVRYVRTPWFGGTPWQKDAPIDLFWSQSPLKDVAKAKTPTLFFVGENDARVPLSQSLEMWRALRANGVPTRLYVAPREGHQWGELRHQVAKANAELEWFERYARGRAYTAEKTP